MPGSRRRASSSVPTRPSNAARRTARWCWARNCGCRSSRNRCTALWVLRPMEIYPPSRIMCSARIRVSRCPPIFRCKVRVTMSIPSPSRAKAISIIGKRQAIPQLVFSISPEKFACHFFKILRRICKSRPRAVARARTSPLRAAGRSRATATPPIWVGM